MRISILLVTWNGLQDLLVCLDSLRNQSFRDFEVVLVDNDSNDGTQEAIRRNHSEVRMIELHENTGFAHACNVAAEHASGELFFVVNTDTEFEPDMLEQLDLAARRYEEFDIFSCQMVNFDERDRVDCKGMMFLPSLRTVMIDFGQPRVEGEGAFEIFGATGGAMLLRRGVIDKIGLFDARLFFNNEDVDFSLRAFGAGFRSLYVPDAIVYHHRSPNEKKMPDLVFYYIQRNYVLATYKNVPLGLYLAFGPLHLAHNAYHMLKSISQGRLKVFLNAKLDALKMAPKLERKPVPALPLLRAMGKKVLKRKK